MRGEQNPFFDLRENIEAVRAIPIFGGLSSSTLEVLLQSASAKNLVSGDYLFREGDPSTSLFVLKSGRVEIEKVWQSEVIVLGHLSAGDCMGEMALIDFQSRSASVRAVEPCEVIAIPPSSLRQLMQQDLPQYTMIMMNLGREVSRRLRFAGKRIMQLEQQLKDCSSPKPP